MRRRTVAALALVFLAGHLFFLPPTLEDIDSINFALGVLAFDVGSHQPHPPGYPIFIALARLSAGVTRAIGLAEPVPRGLALLSAVSGALLVPLLYALFRRIEPPVAWWATVATVCSPLFWFTAVRPLSDMAGLALAVAAQVLLIMVIRGAPAGGVPVGRAARGVPPAAVRLGAGAALAGAERRPYHAAAARRARVPRYGLSWRHRAAALGFAMIAVLAWSVPLVVASGGLGDYLVALGAQGGEDFRGVVMLWTTPHPGVAVEAFLNTIVWPWGALLPGVIVGGLALAGSLRAACQAPAALVLLAIAFAPYAIFHLLFHETPTLRYALPLVPPVVFLALYGLAILGAGAPAIAGIVMAGLSLVWTLPAVHAYARTPSPAFRALDTALAASRAGADDEPGGVLGMHAVMRRVEQWRSPAHGRRVLRAGHGREWLALVEHWRAEPDSVIEFLADPRRTDLVLFDPHARQLAVSAGWTFPEVPFVGGARPCPARLYTMMPPGWMLDRGWALTVEVGGVTSASGLGPHVQPSIAWVRARQESGTLVVGGRNLGGGARTARLTVATPSGEVDSWEVTSGSFVRLIAMPAGLLEGAGYLPVTISAVGVDTESGTPENALEQFDLQPTGVPMAGFLDGWHEPEYRPVTARSWRWMSDRANLWVRPVGRDVTLTLAGESPRRYFERPPVVHVSAAGVELARLQPWDDFVENIRIPAGLLDASSGVLSIESDLWFSPADRQGSADRRRLALRIYGVTVQ